MPEFDRRAKMYRDQAADCRRRAEKADKPPAAKKQWRELAEAYEELAVEAASMSTIQGSD
jgi:hypothetical protein